MGGSPTRTGSPREGSQRRMRGEMSGEVKDSILFKKGILLFYTVALLKDWRVALRVGGNRRAEEDIWEGPSLWNLGKGSHKKWGADGEPKNGAPKSDLQSTTTLCFPSPKTKPDTHTSGRNTD